MTNNAHGKRPWLYGLSVVIFMSLLDLLLGRFAWYGRLDEGMHLLALVGIGVVGMLLFEGVRYLALCGGREVADAGAK